MIVPISGEVSYNSFDYFEKVLIANNGFREYDVRWILGKEVNPNGFFVLGQSYGTFLRDTLNEGKVVVGHDFRAYSQELSRSFIIGLLSSGIDVIDLGLVLTPMLYFSQHYLNINGGAMITASHNENGWTGIKLADGLSSTLGPEGIECFKQIVINGRYRAGKGNYERYSIEQAYIDDILSLGRLTRPKKVALATGNGTAGRFAPRILERLGCEVFEVDCTADWNFPHYNPNTEDISFLHSISKATLQVGADLGIGLDGDGDRIGVIDNTGHEIFSDKLGLVLARCITSHCPGRPIVVDVKSTGLFSCDPILNKNNADVFICKTGHSYIKQKVAEVDAIAGFEKSGHWFFNKPYGRGYDDAILSSVHLLHLLDKSSLQLSEIMEALPRTWQSPTLGVYCDDQEKYAVVTDICAQYLDDQKRSKVIADMHIKNILTVNGVRFTLEDDSWGLVRASSNKPSLVVVAESRKSREHLSQIITHIQKRLECTGKVGEYDQSMPLD